MLIDKERHSDQWYAKPGRFLRAQSTRVRDECSRPGMVQDAVLGQPRPNDHVRWQREVQFRFKLPQEMIVRHLAERFDKHPLTLLTNHVRPDVGTERKQYGPFFGPPHKLLQIAGQWFRFLNVGSSDRNHIRWQWFRCIERGISVNQHQNRALLNVL